MISFQEAATNLERICDKIDNAEEISAELQSAFAEAGQDLASSVDRRISYIKYCESQIDAARNMREEWNDRANKFETILARIKQDAIAAIKANPNLPYKGKMGSLRVQKNSVPRLIIDDSQFSCDDYTQVETTTWLDKAAIIDDIKAGRPLLGARLEYGEHLRMGL